MFQYKTIVTLIKLTRKNILIAINLHFYFLLQCSIPNIFEQSH